MLDASNLKTEAELRRKADKAYEVYLAARTSFNQTLWASCRGGLPGHHEREAYAIAVRQYSDAVMRWLAFMETLEEVSAETVQTPEGIPLPVPLLDP